MYIAILWVQTYQAQTQGRGGTQRVKYPLVVSSRARLEMRLVNSEPHVFQWSLESYLEFLDFADNI